MLWDNFHGRRDGQIRRDQLLSLKNYKIVFEAGQGDADTCNDVVVLLKNNCHLFNIVETDQSSR